MIYLRLAGGLGNQLYQLLAVALLSKRSGVQAIPITSALSLYSTSRNPDSLQILMPNNWLLKPKKISNVTQWAINFGRTGRWLPFMGINDNNFWVNIEKKKYFNTLIVDGYFQQGWNFDYFKEAISNFSLRDLDLQDNEIVGKNECLIHIRGGDFLKIPKFQVVGVAYYVYAIELAIKKGWSRFAIMTDDLSYAIGLLDQILQKIPGLIIRIIPRSSSAISDFNTLRKATSRIIGNSTFAWWASALDDNMGTTWSPTQLTTDKPRDFYLPWENPIGSQVL